MTSFPRFRRHRNTSLALALCLLGLWAPIAQAEKVEQLKPANFVNDFAGVLDPATQSQLNALCLEVQQKTKAEIAVVTIHSLEDRPVEDFAVDLFKKWGVGGKNDNRGVLILLSSGDRKYRVEVGYGLEPILPDGKVGGFGREMVPILREGNYGAALTLLTTRIAQTIAQDANVELSGNLNVPYRRNSAAPSLFSRIILYIIFFLALIIVIRHPSLLIWFLLSGGGGGGGRSSDGYGGGGGFGGFGGGSSGGGGASGSW